MPYGMIGILVISRYAVPPYPAAPDFLHGKACHTILRSLCSLTNRVPLPPHPGDRINRSMLSCRDMAPWLSIHSPTTKWGEGGGASHQRGNLHRPQGGCMVFAAKGGIYTGAPKGAHLASAAILHTSRGRSPQPVREASAGPGQNPWRPGPEARRRHQPSRRSRVNLREYWKAPPWPPAAPISSVPQRSRGADRYTLQ